MKREENIRAILECNLPIVRTEVLDTIVKNIMALEPCSDVVSRQAVKDWFCTNYCSEHNKCEHFEKGDCNAMNELFAIPPVNPQPKTGHWIEHEIKDTCRWLTCSVCGYEWVNKKENFCPDCGSYNGGD